MRPGVGRYPGPAAWGMHRISCLFRTAAQSSTLPPTVGLPTETLIVLTLWHHGTGGLPRLLRVAGHKRPGTPHPLNRPESHTPRTSTLSTHLRVRYPRCSRAVDIMCHPCQWTSLAARSLSEYSSYCDTIRRHETGVLGFRLVRRSPTTPPRQNPALPTSFRRLASRNGAILGQAPRRGRTPLEVL